MLNNLFRKVVYGSRKNRNYPKIRTCECEKYISMYNVMTTMGLYTDRVYYSQFTPSFVGVFHGAHFYSHSNLRNPYIVDSLVPPELDPQNGTLMLTSLNPLNCMHF